ncbi:MAG: UDP binding domain-containing protein, partial [Cyanobium sp.]
LCRHYGLEESASYWESVVTLNTWQQQRIARLVVNSLFGTVSGKRIAILGFAFKADTNDTREAPAIRICRDLIEEGAQLAIVDPKVSSHQISQDLERPPLDPTQAAQQVPLGGEGTWTHAETPIEAAKGADAVVILTEWKAYCDLDWPAIHDVMRRPAWLFDARAVADPVAARAAGLNVWRVGEG